MCSSQKKTWATTLTDAMFQGRSVFEMTPEQLRKFRGEAVALVFQDPMTRLDPLMSIGNHCLETLKAHSPQLSSKEAKERAIATLEKVKIPASRWNQYPHVQRQNGRNGFFKSCVPTTPARIYTVSATSSFAHSNGG